MVEIYLNLTCARMISDWLSSARSNLGQFLQLTDADTHLKTFSVQHVLMARGTELVRILQIFASQYMAVYNSSCKMRKHIINYSAAQSVIFSNLIQIGTKSRLVRQDQYD